MEGIAEHELGSRKARLALRVLGIAQGRPVTIERLERGHLGLTSRRGDPPAQVAVIMSRLRRVLGASRISHGDAGYALHADWVDMSRRGGTRSGGRATVCSERRARAGPGGSDGGSAAAHSPRARLRGVADGGAPRCGAARHTSPAPRRACRARCRGPGHRRRSCGAGARRGRIRRGVVAAVDGGTCGAGSVVIGAGSVRTPPDSNSTTSSGTSPSAQTDAAHVAVLKGLSGHRRSSSRRNNRGGSRTWHGADLPGRDGELRALDEAWHARAERLAVGGGHRRRAGDRQDRPCQRLD